MKIYKLLMLCVVILFALVSVSAVCSSDSNGQIVNGLNSVSDVNQALNDAQHSNKSVLLIFDQDSCYYCDQFKKDTLNNKEVQKILNEKFDVVFVDINKQTDVAVKHHVMGTPTCVILDSNGNDVSKIEGYVTSDEFLNAIKEI